MTALELHREGGASIAIDQQAILRALKLDPRDPNTQALLLVCDRYQLDPLLKHMVLISGTPYVTRDGYLSIAHRSGQFDGMEVVEQGETTTHYTAKVAVYRKDMGRPFAFVGRFPKSKSMAKEYGPEMAVKVAEVQALCRAFNVTGIASADERWEPVDAQVVEDEVVSPDEAQLLKDALNSPASSGQIRHLFKQEFGMPDGVWASRFGEAQQWINEHISEPPPIVAEPREVAPDSTAAKLIQAATEPHPGKTKRTLTPAQRLHIRAGEIDGVGETGLDLLILAATDGRTTSANELDDAECAKVQMALEDLDRWSVEQREQHLAKLAL